jgi:mannose/fructose/N-acetylgalactosamine-specific phosphotransferase system component IID
MFFAFAAVAVLFAAGGAFVGYKYGSKVVADLREAYAYAVDAHSAVKAKLAAVKAEVEKIEVEAKAEEKAVVARLKALL